MSIDLYVGPCILYVITIVGFHQYSFCSNIFKRRLLMNKEKKIVKKTYVGGREAIGLVHCVVIVLFFSLLKVSFIIFLNLDKKDKIKKKIKAVNMGYCLASIFLISPIRIYRI